MRRLASVVLFACLVPAAIAQDTWMSVLLDGRKVGHLHVSRDTEGNRVTTQQSLAMRMTRAGKPVPLTTTSTSLETLDGQPLGFSVATGLSSRTSTSQATRRDDGNFQVTTDVGDQSRVDLLAWPTGARLAEGQRQTMLAQGFARGTRYRMRNFDGGARQYVDVTMLVVGDELVALPDGNERLHHLRQILQTGHGEQSLDLWLDNAAHVRKTTAPLLGFQLEMLACSQACALAADQDVDVFRMSMVDAPRPITASMREEPMRYIVELKGTARDQLIATDDQMLSHIDGDLWQLDVGSNFHHLEAPPDESDVASTAWLQSANAVIHDAAVQAVGDASTNLAKMRLLRLYVSEHINEHGLDVGYASALEAMQTRKGDCTENAVLLTAMARSLGIPARVVTGMVYSSRVGGASRVFVPHAWTQAWIDGRWQSFDAALRRFDSSHIALAVGDGDPWRFYASVRVFGNVVITKATPLSSIFDVAPPTADAPPSSGNMR